jgi:hypothetical protein
VTSRLLFDPILHKRNAIETRSSWAEEQPNVFCTKACRNQKGFEIDLVRFGVLVARFRVDFKRSNLIRKIPGCGYWLCREKTAHRANRNCTLSSPPPLHVKLVVLSKPLKTYEKNDRKHGQFFKPVATGRTVWTG